MDPLDPQQKGKTISVSGTTNLAAGTPVTIGYSILAHSCPLPKVTDKPGERTFCGGSCKRGTVRNISVDVANGNDSINIWNASLDATDLCLELYGIGVEAGTGNNSVRTGQEFWYTGL
jgi:hypothetical protein